MKSHAYSLIKFLIGWPLSAAALFFIIKLVLPHSSTIASQLAHINLFLLFWGMVSFCIFYFLRSIVWHLIIKGFGYNLSLRESAHMWSISEMKRYLPGNIWSFVGRTVLFIEKGVKKKDLAAAFFLEIEFFIMAGLLVAPIGLPYVFHGFNLTQPLLVMPITIVLLLFLFHRKLTQYLPKKISSFINFALPHQSATHISLLVGLNVLSLLFFGLGYYFTIGSYITLDPHLLVLLIGFFVLSLIGGYLSLLTPAGFGVREGIIVWGLIKITTTAAAAFASLFSRFILIFSELIFIGLCVLWYQSKKVQKIEPFVARFLYEIILSLLVIVYAIYFTIMSFLRYDNFFTGRFDLGNMAQTVWNTMHGRIFVFTDPNGVDAVSRLAFHADFILVLFAPFYALWSNPKILLLIQTVIVGAGAFFVYFIAKDILKNKNLSLLFAFLYLFNPSLERANLYDFHAVTLATTFLLGVYYFYRKKRYVWLLVFAILASLCKEQIWLITGLFGIFLFIAQKKRVLGTGIFLFSLGMFYYLIWKLIPQTHGSEHFALSYYSDFGDGPSKIIKTIILSPNKILALVLQPDRIDYLKQIFSPLGYLSLLAPVWLLFAIPDLLINILSNNAQLHQIYYQYTSTITPFLFIAVIHAVALIKRLLPKVWHVSFSHRQLPDINVLLILFFLAVSLNAAYLYGPLPGAKDANLDMITKPVADRTFIENYISHIPKRYSVAASNNIGSHLSQRQRIYVLPLGIDKADIIVYLVNGIQSAQTRADEKHFLAIMQNDSAYYQTVQRDGFYVFAKYESPLPPVRKERKL